MSDRTRVAVLALLIAVGVTLLIATPFDDEKAAPKTVTTKVDTGDKGKEPDKKLVVPADAVQEAAEDPTDRPNAKNETPPGVPPSVIEEGREKQDDSAIEDLLPVGIPLAAPTVPGCLSRFVARNYSSRRGVAPKLWVIHWSGGRNLPGYQDVSGLTAFGNTEQAKVSWNFNLDREGHCHYNVNVLNKAWTQAGFNPWSISVEIINTGGPNDKPLLSARGLKVLGKVIAYTAKPFHIPLRLGAVDGCAPTRSGIVSHKMLGACGGGHPDVGDYPLAPIITAARDARAATSSTRTKARTACRALQWQRKQARREGYWKPRRVARARELKVIIGRGRLACPPAG